MDRASIISIEEVCKRCDLYTKHCGMLECPSQCVQSGHFIDGYRKAEKDLALTADEIRLIFNRVRIMFRWQIEKAFKAGAEWMAGQGCTVEIDEGYFINNPHHDRRKGKFHKYYSSTFGHSEKIVVTPGDKVVVQIRKK